MSSVIRPAGPLPQRVYWVRRLLLLTIVVLVITVLLWVLGRITGQADQAAEAGGSTGAGLSQTPPDPGSGSGGGGGSGRGAGSGQHQGGENVREPGSNGHHKPQHHNKPVLAQPTGDCEPSDVAMKVDVDNAKSGHSTPIGLMLTSVSTPACTLAITPEALVLRITSGDDVIWSSDDCPDQLLAQEVVVRQRPATIYTFDWNGRRSTEQCNGSGTVAEAGGYWAEAALVGADAHRAYFDVR